MTDRNTDLTQEQLNQLDEWREKITERLGELESKIEDRVEDELDLADVPEEIRKDRKRLRAMRRIWENGGYIDGLSDKVTVEQLIKKDIEYTTRMRDSFSTDHPLLIPRVLSEMAREAIEPVIVLTGLLQRINYSAGTQLVFPAWGAISAADVPEGGEYPERSLELAGQVTATIGKAGVAVKFSEEMIRYSQFDVMSAHVRAAGRAMQRWKEQKVANMLFTENTNVIMYGATTSPPSTAKRVTGRDPSGAYNSTLTLDDLFYAYGQMVNNGFIPDTLIMHPFAWEIFANEAIARAFGFANGRAEVMWQAPQGVGSAKANQFRVGGLNQQTVVGDPGNLARTATNVPTIFPTGFRVIVTPFAPFDASNKVTDLILADSRELGVLVVDEELTTEEWTDPARDLRKIKFRERYAVAPINSYLGVGLLKDISVKRGIDFADRISLTYGTGDLSDSLTGDGYYK